MNLLNNFIGRKFSNFTFIVLHHRIYRRVLSFSYNPFLTSLPYLIRQINNYYMIAGINTANMVPLHSMIVISFGPFLICH